ncbi:MAG: hypothetical protein KGS72_13240 [Cyanobacteria bacterium REEB67]|nr:hypothetical protein [Cyanobacteria bacterium REEB67]
MVKHHVKHHVKEEETKDLPDAVLADDARAVMASTSKRAPAKQGPVKKTISQKSSG